MKSAWIAFIGRPSVGKSTLLNRLCGHKVSIVAPSPQTTRNLIRGIVSEPRGQLVLVDTPGFHLSEKKLNRYLQENTQSALAETDQVLYLLDCSRAPGREEDIIAEKLAALPQNVIVGINKIDQPEADTKKVSEWVESKLPHSRSFLISAKDGKGVQELLEALFDAAAEGEPYYPEEYYTDQEPEFRITEIIREQVINRLRQELPHAVYVAVEDLERNDEEGKLWVRAVIYVERESQKGMVVGKKGVGIAAIRKASQKELSKIFEDSIYLDLRVKADPKWRGRDSLLSKLRNS